MSARLSVHRPHFQHPEQPLLPSVQQQHQHQQQGAFLVTPTQLRRIGGVFALLLLLFIGSSFHRHYKTLQQQTLSTCPTRLAALGLDLNAAASLDRAHFATSSSSSSTDHQTTLLHGLKRRKLYEQMAADLQSHGLHLGDVITQGLVQADLFEILPPAGLWAARGRIKPVLHALETPVRAVVLPLLDHEASHQLLTVVRSALLQLLAADCVWQAPDEVLHVTLYHASDQQHPVPATARELQQEVAAVAALVGKTCPIRVVLDRITIAASGAVVACWQVLPGSGEPATLRSQLADLLPHAPPIEQQVIQHSSIFHMTVARLLAPARHSLSSASSGGRAAGAGHTAARGHGEAWDVDVLQQALVDVAEDLTDELCGLVAQFDEAWLVEEQDLLALGLGGRYVQHNAGQFSCPKQ